MGNMKNYDDRGIEVALPYLNLKASQDNAFANLNDLIFV